MDGVEGAGPAIRSNPGAGPVSLRNAQREWVSTRCLVRLDQAVRLRE